MLAARMDQGGSTVDPQDVLLAQRLRCLLEERETFGPARRAGSWRAAFVVIGAAALLGACVHFFV